MARISGTPNTEAVVGDRPTLTLPVSRACCAARAAWSAWRRASCASRKNANPASVGTAPLEVRCSSRVLSSPSSRLICWLSADCTMSRSSRRPAHGAEFDDADEVAKLAQFHGAMVAQSHQCLYGRTPRK